MTRAELFEQIKRKKSYLCVGLDTDITKIPGHLLKLDDPVFEFNRQLIQATREYAVAYKLNLAFYESLGPSGLSSLEKTVRIIPQDMFTIADAKRGDIGNTSAMYAKTFFEYYDFDAVTVSPYMGKDSVSPYLEFRNKWTILLALTSNNGAGDFQMKYLQNYLMVAENMSEPVKYRMNSENRLFEEVLECSRGWGNPENMMYVIGATHPKMFEEIRLIVPMHFLLVPGIGAQGGSLHDVSKYGMNKQCGLLVNSSRQIIYASGGADFADKAGNEAMKLQHEMKNLLEEYFK